MDPTFAALLNDLKAQGFTDNMLSWLAGLSADEWGTKVRQIQTWLAALTPEQRVVFGNLASYDEANQFMWGRPLTPTTGPTGPTAPGTPPTPTAPTPTTPTPTTPAKSKNDGAWGTIQRMLEEAGLGSVADWAWKRYQEGASIDTIMVELYDRPEFKAIYPEYDILAKKGRAYSVAQLQATKKQYAQLMRQYGLPPGMYDTPEELSKLAAGEVSLGELSQRLAGAAEAVYQSSPVIRDEMSRLYNVGVGDMIAYWLDPDRAEPLIRQQWVSSQIGGASRQSGFGLLTRSEAEALAGQGVDYAAASKGFSDLARSQELFNPVSTGETAIGRDVQLGAEFGGNADAQQTVERRRDQRKAVFQDGGGFATTRQGIAGV